MNQYSDSESNDSDQGIRYKTDSTRHRSKNLSSRSSSRSRSPNIIPKERSHKIGPELPPRLLKDDPQASHIGPQLSSQSTKSEDSNEDTTQESSYIGPQLPSHLQKKKEDSSSPQSTVDEDSNEEATQESSIGPQLPPHLQKKKEGASTSSYGPLLPPHLLKKQEDPPSIGPYLPPHLRQKLQEETHGSESEEEEIYGPLPVDAAISSRAQIALEERALQLKMDQLEPNKDTAPIREEWMVELPEVKASKFGLGPRQFRSKAGPDMSDRSSWTDTPDKKKKKKIEKVDLKKEMEMQAIRKRDEEQEKTAKKLKKKNKESLLEIHQTKMMEKKKEEGTGERRPFSRETDLQVNRFDEAQKKAVLKKAQLLDNRFSSGQSKFL